jgi:hypothetical protein
MTGSDQIAQLAITLDTVKPPVRRRIEVPLAIRLDRLHRVFQIVMAGRIITFSSALLKSRFDQPGSAVIAMARMASPSQAAAIRMNATASSV